MIGIENGWNNYNLTDDPSDLLKIVVSRGLSVRNSGSVKPYIEERKLIKAINKKMEGYKDSILTTLKWSEDKLIFVTTDKLFGLSLNNLEKANSIIIEEGLCPCLKFISKAKNIEKEEIDS